ncbi:MAG TPA: hypothetical protein VM802_16935 [Chitinophaga sp.]|uniref:sensor histidine kinase n=1 Tax=Chitinophaga sp. TaxID=1869181 RepID=UPI002C6EC2A9|nr:hypothetical protein [Chitinophaga sp.]HVI46565.1 hypothetical protein [Chitinophaga sp.]
MHKSYMSHYSALWALVVLLCISLKVTAQSPQLPELQQELARQQDTTGYVKVLGKIGALYAMINLDSSFHYALQVMDLSERHHNQRGLADAFSLMSWYYALKTDFNIATMYAYKALQLQQAVGDSSAVVKTLSNIYLFYRNTGRPVEANNYFYRAFHMASRLPPAQDSTYGILLINYAMRFYKDSTRTDSVKWALQQCRKIMQKYPRNRILLYVRAYEANEMVKAGRGKEAEALIYSLAQEAQQRGLPYVAMDMYNRLDDFGKMGYPVDTTFYRERSYELARATGCEELNLFVLAGLYDYYTRMNQQDKVAWYSAEIMRLAGQDRYHATTQSINYIDYFLKEQSLQSLAMTNRLQQQELEKKRAEKRTGTLRTAGLTLVALLLIVLLVAYYFSYRRSRKEETVLEQSYKAIQHKNEELWENDAFKNKLITILANDFREPLHHISTVAAQLKSGELESAAVASLLKHISASSRKTLDIFDSILKWIRLQLSGFTYTPVQCELSGIIQAVLIALQPTMKERQATLINRLPASLPVLADPEMLRLVNMQLLQTAATVAEPQTLLVISAIAREHRTHISISVDAGANAADKLYTLLNWQENMPALGFVISRDFIGKMNGELSAGVEDNYIVITYMI